jgi:XTP/dITP diphosphohydrolase
MNLILATHNRGKVIEFKRIFEGIFDNFYSVLDLGILAEPEENGSSFSANSKIKLDYYLNELKNINGQHKKESYVMAEDSGIEIDALDGAPGIKSARFGGPKLNSKGRNDLVLSKLKDVPLEERSARFVCNIRILNIENNNQREFVGKCEGIILEDSSGINGFGYDPIFKPLGYNTSMANLPDQKKDEISHRGIACNKLKEGMF